MRVSVAVLLLAYGLSSAPIAGTQGSQPVPIVVELFTSEGCSSCPPADELLQRLRQANQKDFQLILLGEHVDYWNGLGWTDRFSSRTFTDRQSGYSSRFKLSSVYTPQMVIDGRVEKVGNDSAAVYNSILEEAKRQKPVEIVLAWSAPKLLDVAVKGAHRAGASVMFAITEDDLTTQVDGGENGGRVLHHTAVVRRLQRLGTVSTDSFHLQIPISLESDWNAGKIAVVVWVEDQTGITGAASIRNTP